MPDSHLVSHWNLAGEEQLDAQAKAAAAVAQQGAKAGAKRSAGGAANGGRGGKRAKKDDGAASGMSPTLVRFMTFVIYDVSVHFPCWCEG